MSIHSYARLNVARLTVVPINWRRTPTTNPRQLTTPDCVTRNVNSTSMRENVTAYIETILLLHNRIVK